jgi:hypothetical protein
MWVLGCINSGHPRNEAEGSCGCYSHGAGAQPLGCRILEPCQGVGESQRPPQISRFCSLKAALLGGGPEAELPGGINLRRPEAATRIGDWPSNGVNTQQRRQGDFRNCPEIASVMRRIVALLGLDNNARHARSRQKCLSRESSVYPHVSDRPLADGGVSAHPRPCLAEAASSLS